MNRFLAVLLALTLCVQSSFAARGIENSRGYSRGYEYTDRHELYSLVLPDDNAEFWSYNANGDVSQYTNGEFQQTQYTYDDASRMTLVNYSLTSQTDVTLEYDDADRLIEMADGSGTTAWAYDGAGRVTSMDSPNGEVTYGYDDAARMDVMSLVGVGDWTYVYDELSRIETITNPFAEDTVFEYDECSRLGKKTLESGAYETYSYDDRSRVTSIALKNSSHTALSSHSYTYTETSDVQTRTDNSVTTTFGYDEISQLTSESRTGYSASYTYDANGNRLTRTVGSVTEDYAYDAADKLQTVKIGTTTIKSFAYDLAGRTTSVTTSAGTTNLSWDYEDRLTGITYPSTSTNSFTYNAFGERATKTDSGGTKEYARAFPFAASLVLSDGDAVYTAPGSERRGSTTTYRHSAIKNSVAETNSSQSVTGTKAYDAYGNQVSSTGTWNSPFGYGGSLGYHADEDSGLKLCGLRYYDSATGRFLSSDALGWGGNWYAYAANNPISFGDPWGVMPEWAPVDTPWLDGGPESIIFIGAAPDQGLTDLSNFFAGWGDGLTGGWTDSLRDLLGVNGVIDKESGLYRGGIGVGTAHRWFLTRGAGGGFTGIAKATGKSKNKMTYDRRANGDHTTIRRGKDGRVERYQEWHKSADPRNPNSFTPGKRFDGVGKPDYDKTTKQWIGTPHVNLPGRGGGVRPPRPDELPRGY